jgi:erythronate-4-phosphate dehydrogenase
MKVLLNDPPREAAEEDSSIFTDIDTIMREADIITFHTPLTTSGIYKTHHLADTVFFDHLHRKPVIINAARGGIIDNRALTTALLKGTVSGAVIDCWENEPEIDRELLELVDIATPHIAGYSADGKWTATRMSIESLNRFFALDIQPRFQEIPAPLQPVIDLQGIALEKQLSHAVWHTYNPMTETAALKAAPANFYRFRSDYPLRREYSSYRIVNADSSLTGILQLLGFSIL